MFVLEKPNQEIVATISRKSSEHLLWQGIAQTGCKAGSLCQTQSGDILAVWYGGEEFTGDESEETSLWFAKYSTGSWTKPVCLYKERGFHIWNPVLFPLPSGNIRLFFRKFSPKIAEPQKEKYGLRDFSYHVMTSGDNGETWSPPEQLPEGVLSPAKSVPLITKEGVWIFPCAQNGNAFLQITHDEGKNWQRVGPIGKGLTEPALAESDDGTILIFLRNRQVESSSRYVMRAMFDLNAMTFTDPIPTSMPNPDAGIDVIRAQDGSLLLAANPSHTARTPLALYRSFDDGVTWKHIYTLENGSGDFAQPSLIQTADGKVHVFYYYWPAVLATKNVKHQVIALD